MLLIHQRFRFISFLCLFSIFCYPCSVTLSILSFIKPFSGPLFTCPSICFALVSICYPTFCYCYPILSSSKFFLMFLICLIISALFSSSSALFFSFVPCSICIKLPIYVLSFIIWHLVSHAPFFRPFSLDVFLCCSL